MTETADRLRGAARWSMAARCARQASYGLLGVDPVPPSPREQGRFARGRDAGQYFARQMAAKYGVEDVHFEFPVPWPGPPALPVGELHVDVAVMSEKLAIEAKNSVWIDSMFDSAVIQVAGAVHFSPHFEAGLVVFLDNDYQITHEFPVFLTDELIEKVEKIAREVMDAGKSGDVPPRICERPSDGRGKLCPFIEHCFAGWEAPLPTERPDLSQLASEGWIIQRDLRAAKGNVDELQRQWDDWKQRALEAQLAPGETMADGIRIKRIDSKGRETFSLAKARTSGVWTPLHDEMFGPFTKIGEPSTRFELIRTEAAGDLDLDFGEEAPF